MSDHLDDGARLALRATSFGAAADDYDRYRPGPPAEAVEWILPAPVGLAVDLAAGTGALSRVLTARAGQVVAVEADPRMAAVLASRGGPPVSVGRSEALPLAAGSVDAVVVSSAWHWMDEAAAVDEVVRVLRPGGTFGVLWSGPDRSVPWVSEVATGGAGIRALIGERVPEVDEARRRRRRVSLHPGAPFTDVDQTLLHWSLPYATADFPGLAGTYSTVIVSSPEQRRELAAAVTAAVAATPETAGRAVVDLPMRSLCWRAVRA